LTEGYKVIAIDSEKKSINFVKIKCKVFKNKFKVRKMNGQKLSYGDNFFDGVSSIFVIPFVEELARIFID
jgi:ubiquinone/menaquinone biosynthesis C-methylase UbiE